MKQRILFFFIILAAIALCLLPALCFGQTVGQFGIPKWTATGTQTQWVTPQNNKVFAISSSGALEMATAGGGGTFASLTDVAFTSLVTGQIPRYNSTSGDWENYTPPWYQQGSEPSFADSLTLTNDGFQESSLIMGSQGSLVWTLNTGGIISASRTVNPADADGILAVTQDAAGRIDLASAGVFGLLPLAKIAQGSATSGQALAWNGSAWAPATVGVSDGEKGDITVSGSGATWTIDSSITLTTPRIAQIHDTNGNEALILGTTASAVNEVSITNAATAGHPVIEATGANTNISMVVKPKGTGYLRLGKSANPVLIGDPNSTTVDGLIVFDGNTNGVAISYDKSGVAIGATARLSWTNGAPFTGTSDLFMSREAAAILQAGVDVNGNAVDQTIKAADGITGTDRSGGDLALASGNSTGAGTSAIIFKVPSPGATGTTANAASEQARINADGMIVNGVLNVNGTVRPVSFASAGTPLVWAESDGDLTITPSPQTNVPDPSGVTSAEDVEARAAISAILTRLEALGLFAP